MIKQLFFEHPFEAAVLHEMLQTMNFKKEIEEHYILFEEKKRRPDLLGKTVRVSEKQFPKIFQIAKEIGRKTGLAVPDIFVYEDFYYAIDSKGIQQPWIEMSASIMTDFSEKEIEFMLAREIGKVHYKHTYYNTLLGQSLEMLEKGLVPFGDGMIEDKAKVVYYRWSRITNYSADCFGYLVCRDLEAATKAIMKCVLNSVFLAKSTNLLEYIKQAEAINELHDNVYEATKSDEQYPYGPFRIKNLLAFASSKRAVEAGVIREAVK